MGKVTKTSVYSVHHCQESSCVQNRKIYWFCFSLFLRHICLELFWVGLGLLAEGEHLRIAAECC